MKNLPFQKVLALSPHTDDIEFGCGGTLTRLQEQGAEIHTAIFSHCEKSVPAGFPKDVLKKEMYKAADILNIKENNIHTFNFPVREFPKYRQDILENMVELKKEINPELVLTTSTFDVHQDHEVVSRESIRAFRFTTLLGYEVPWNNLQFPSQVVIELSDRHIKNKLEAVDCYQSQKFRKYGAPQLFRKGAEIRGVKNRRDMVEIFEAIKVYF
jgi:LmbE family N-acetylglucosaminyl deacetylase